MEKVEETKAAMPTYRPEIDGLRAVSILAVVLYHAGLPGFEAGYLGVDVFFVVSGFLISDQLVRERSSTGTIQMAAFYARRVRRLVPAFVAMALGTCILVLLYLPLLAEQRKFGNALTRSAAFYYNIALWRGGYDYEAPMARQQILMHTWSLGVEEQFYLVWPWVCLALTRLRWPLAGFSTLALTSLIAAWWWLPRDEAAVFFLIPFRVWELAFGACLATRGWRSSSGTGFAGTAAGLGFLLGGLLSGEHGPSPPWDQALVVAGTGMVIGFGSAPTSASLFLRVGPMVFLGRLSYAWYLWHWPLLTISRIRTLGPSPLIDAAVLGGSLVLAGLTYACIERPARRITIKRPTRVLIAGLGALVAIALLGVGIEERSHRLATRPEYTTRLGPFSRPKARPCEAHVASLGCDLSPNTRSTEPVLLLWGDSFARVLSPALSMFAEKSGARVRLLSKPGCAPLLGAVPKGGMDALSAEPSCASFLEAVRVELQRDPGRVSGVILVGRWPALVGGDSAAPAPRMLDTKGLEPAGPVAGLATRIDKTLGFLQSIGQSVLVVGAPPEFPFEVQSCLLMESRPCVVARAWKQAARTKARLAIETSVRRYANARYVDLFDALCPNTECSGGTLDAPLLADKYHFSSLGAESALPFLAPSIDWVRGRDALK
jgi:peptidoglycan/LPS O-acetylase OafA/YrhL